MSAPERWVAWIRGVGGAPERVLAVGVALDVWERQGDSFLVAAEWRDLGELERRQIAHVEWLGLETDVERSQHEPPEERGLP